MTAVGQKRTLPPHFRMSAFPQKQRSSKTVGTSAAANNIVILWPIAGAQSGAGADHITNRSLLVASELAWLCSEQGTACLVCGEA